MAGNEQRPRVMQGKQTRTGSGCEIEREVEREVESEVESESEIESEAESESGI